jgi:8-oxo-dGTP diphosphatase
MLTFILPGFSLYLIKMKQTTHAASSESGRLFSAQDPTLCVAQVSVDCVIFTFHEGRLKVAAHKVYGLDDWILPGGYILQQENLDDAAARILSERTGLRDGIYLRQFHTFGQADRSFGRQFKSVAKKIGIRADDTIIKWISQRFITVGYVALVGFEKARLTPGGISEECTWMNVDKAGTLSLDHPGIVQQARNFLIRDLANNHAVNTLLPSRFTLSELHQLYEQLLGRSIDRPNFRRKILSSEVIVKVGKQQNAPGRPADVYRFRKTKKTVTERTRLGF